MRPAAAVAFRVGHGDADRQVAVLHVVQVSREALAVARAFVGIDARRCLADGRQPVVRQITLRAARFLAEQAHRFELVEQVGTRGIDVQHAVDALAARGLHRAHDRRELVAQGEVVGHAERVDARLQRREIGDALDPITVDEDARLAATQGLAIVAGVHRHGDPRQERCGELCRCRAHDGKSAHPDGEYR